MKIFLSTLFLFSIASAQAQSELKISVNIFYQDKAFDIADDSPFRDFELDFLKDANQAYSYNLGYSYFLNNHHGIGLQVGYSINNSNYKEPIILKNSSNETVGESIGQKAHFIDVATVYHFRSKKDSRSNTWFDLGVSIGTLQKVVYRENISIYDDPSQQTFTSIEGGILGFEEDHKGYYYIGLEPTTVWSLGRNRQDRGIDLSIGLPSRVLTNSEKGTKFLVGFGIGVNFIL